ncbi:mechanosensitive ion channel family protein [Curtobacterium poinsettiae]|jgi:small-conductance mechanosensitive channel|uniref:Mechanosensitive ion channel n=1 Tax=Curtobacterium poinsettiae TaxID=159612 RepID=A0ABT3S3A4_9MICO|nr:mechanosensitive ion channel domain-containing protein [Curtobacterium flaccumfaciens]MBT1609496.1 mechanosensitive ion channel family protein [Curtobacterium flaccumfaciens pv. poinsettiae]MCX2849270.1 mechanosensitive ion channel [Curtobacterium flaccumfaciens pv. poinsettiae]UXN17844.1 mechanosensitive ion channel family protein [Curtobacterium flaccumfaciens pv. poinsettiae]
MDILFRLLVAIGFALLVTALVALVLHLVLRAVARRERWAGVLSRRTKHPFRTVLLVVLLWIAFTSSIPRDPDAYPWRDEVVHGFLIVTIAVGCWLACHVAIFLEDLGLHRFRIDVPDNRQARRIRTQVLIIRRLTVALLVIIAVGAILLTFDGVEAAGASVLASAGLISVVAGLAAQSTLGNVFAGMQLAFSGSIRVDDVVVVEQQWGRIEEITLTYVVVHLWDDRRFVLPSTYFTSTPFENWTRTGSELLGAVEFDLDWRVSPADMRAELDRILETSTIWDRRVKVLQVTDAVGGLVRVRILVTAPDAGGLFDLRCYVREEMVEWIQRTHPDALPVQRVQLTEPTAPALRRRGRGRATEGDSQLFGDDERGALFTGPIQTSGIPDSER